MKKHKKSFIATSIKTVAFALLSAISAHSVADVIGARVSDEPSKSRLVLDMDKSAEHSVFTLSNPHRVVIDISDTKIKNQGEIHQIRTSLITKVRTGIRNGNDARLVLEVGSETKVNSFLLPDDSSNKARLVVDLTTGEKAKPIKVFSDTRRNIIVVVDPGHGGKAPGAIGPSGLREKDVVLKLSKILAGKINKMPGYQAVLTRSDDRYLQLRERTNIARDNAADLMLSVHADAFKSPRPKGASVFALSQGGASSETALWLADNENKADLIGGSGSVSLSDKDMELKSVLLDLSMTSTINTSLLIGSKILNEIGGVTELHKDQVEQAGFVVLKSPDIPSLLIEAGFISNPGEERKLKSERHLEKIASSIASGLDQYFKKVPPPGTLLASRGMSKPSDHMVKPGDTLSGIASQYGVSLSRLRDENQIKNDVLWIGQKVRIPAS